MQGFTDPWKFDPDRFSPKRQEDIIFGKNFMPFGHGPHYCVGKEYAINHLTAFLAIIATRQDSPFRHKTARLHPTVIHKTLRKRRLRRPVRLLSS